MNADAAVSPGLVRIPWEAGPCDGMTGFVGVSVTDFEATSESDLQLIAKSGLELRRAWPVMHGAVGLWLWMKPEELRGGAVSVWQSRADLKRFVRWPAHAEIMKSWRGRISVVSHYWDAEQFSPDDVWARAEAAIGRPHAGPK